MTRLKGVLMLVGLAYFAALSLFFLKEEMVNRAKHAFNTERWDEFSPPDHSYRVKLPQPLPTAPSSLRPLQTWKLTCYMAVQKRMTGPGVVFVVGTGRDPKGEAGEEDWFEEVRRAIAQDTNTDPGVGTPLPRQGHPGREWRFPNLNGGFRIVQVYRVEGMIYYLSAECWTEPEPDDSVYTQFFQSFEVPRANKQPG
jgi:hypothetical protein